MSLGDAVSTVSFVAVSLGAGLVVLWLLWRKRSRLFVATVAGIGAASVVPLATGIIYDEPWLDNLKYLVVSHWRVLVLAPLIASSAYLARSPNPRPGRFALVALVTSAAFFAALYLVGTLLVVPR